MTHLHRRWSIVLLIAAACGCGDDGEPQGGAGAGAGDGARSGAGGAGGTAGGGDAGGGALSYRPCSDEDRVGSFSLHAVAETAGDIPAQTKLFGEVLDGVPPADVWDELASDGGCRVIVGPQHGPCDPLCSSEQTCGPDGCIPTPRTHSVGTVTVGGLLQPVSMMPSGLRRYSQPSALPYPPYEEGAEIELSAEGGDYAAFTLRGAGVPLLEVAEGEITVESGRAVPLRWTAADGGDAAPAQVFVELNIAHHGGVAASIECDVEDDGELEIPAELVTRLVERGTAGFPTVTLTRRTIDSVQLEPGCVEFEVGSQVIRDVTVPGVTSCSNEHPCPDGRTCREETLTCS